MSLKPKLRGTKWQAVGRVEFDGLPITPYLRRSTGSSTEAGAREFIARLEEREKRRYLLGREAEKLTFEMAVLEYNAKPADAKYLLKVLKARPEVGVMPLEDFSGKFIKNIGLEIYPDAATDTIWRAVVTPVRAVINNMHELGKGPSIKIRAFSEVERIKRDTLRGKTSRQPRKAASKAWIEAFCAHADIYNAALVRFMFETGARIDQAVSLTPKDLDLMNKRVHIKAQKGHPAQWIDISRAMMIEIANLPAKRPRNRKRGYDMEPRVFGYGSKGGYRKRWKTICAQAGIESLKAHEAGRHGFATELMVRQGVDPITVALAGRWKSPQLVLSTYGHSEISLSELRERFRTDHEQGSSSPPHNPLKKQAN